MLSAKNLSNGALLELGRPVHDAATVGLPLPDSSKRGLGLRSRRILLALARIFRDAGHAFGMTHDVIGLPDVIQVSCACDRAPLLRAGGFARYRFLLMAKRRAA